MSLTIKQCCYSVWKTKIKSKEEKVEEKEGEKEGKKRKRSRNIKDNVNQLLEVLNHVAEYKLNIGKFYFILH